MILHVISVISFRNLFIYVNNSRHFIYIIICNTHHNFECINNKDKRFFMVADRTPAIRKISQCLSFQNLFCTKFSATCVSASFDRVSRKKTIHGNILFTFCFLRNFLQRASALHSRGLHKNYSW